MLLCRCHAQNQNNNQSNNQNDKVVGVFLDEQHAQQAIQALQSEGYNARIADESAISAFRKSGFEQDVVDLAGHVAAIER